MTIELCICYQRFVKIISLTYRCLNGLTYFSIPMKNIFFYLIFLSFSISQSQNLKISPTLVNSAEIDANYFVGFDGFGTIYYVKNNVLFKKNGATFLQYQNLSLGKLTKVDITNPLKIILFYEEFNSVTILDNQLNEIQKVEFSKLETPIVASAIGIAAQNQIWLYNSLNQQIGLYDLNSNTYKNLGIPIKETFSYYQTDFNYFHWIDKQNQWMTCTIFGRVFSNGKVDASSELLLIDNNKILYSKDNQLFLKDTTTNQLFEIEIVEKTFEKFYYKDQILSIFTNKGITNYKITIP
jgi:hypothetical protein